jgi:hypothetical protein
MAVKIATYSALPEIQDCRVTNPYIKSISHHPSKVAIPLLMAQGITIAFAQYHTPAANRRRSG